jgi:hypothetical protein
MLHTIAVISLIISVVCGLIIAGDILAGNHQQMRIMNFVYPITALYGGIFALVFYYCIGKNGAKNRQHTHRKPFWQSVAIGALHCGSGCTLGDIFAEALLFYMPVLIFGSKLAGTWTIDYIFAFVIGILFQYYAIKPMGKLSTVNALKAALKADTLSLTSWQAGMYGWMAICFFVLFKNRPEPTDPVFWLMMQVAMLFGFATAYPVNRWLIKKGIKEAM